MGFFAFTSPVSTEIKPDGTAKIGDACTSSSQCVTGNCEDSYCVCNDKGVSEGSAHCAARYFGQPDDWVCLDHSADERKYHGDHLQFCQRSTFLGGTKPEISDDNVKYPQDKKSLMGHACNSTANCITDNSDSLDSWCEETQFNSSNDPSSPYYDPWYTPGKKLKVCECGGDSLSETSNLCALQYGGTASDWPSTGESAVSVCRESTSPELEGLLVCRKSNDWMPKTLAEMRSSVAPQDNNSVQTTILGFDISTKAPELVTPETKIGIPGVFFTKITKESNITADEFGASWLNIPFLGEFISAIYKYSVGLISLIAVMVLIISGVQIITSAGNSEAISSAKHRIVSSVIAIVITAGSYTILYTVNPDLVNLKNLKILVVPGKTIEVPENESGASIPETQVDSVVETASNTSGAAPVDGPPYVCGNKDKGTYDARRADCLQWCQSNTNKSTWPQYVKGNLLESETQRGLSAPGIKTASNNVRIPNIMVDSLKQVGLAAQNHPEGPFTIQINDGWRPLSRAIEYVCKKFTDADELRAQGKNVEADKLIKTIGPVLSFPGANAHNIATGGAVDVLLLDSDNKPLVRNGWFNYDTQTDPSKTQAVRILAEIFYSVPGWQRYLWEIWHFDYNSTSALRTKTCKVAAPNKQTCPQ